MTDRHELEVRLPVRGMLIGFLVIFALLILATAATHFIPAGTYDRQSRIDERTGSTLEARSLRADRSTPLAEGASSALRAPELTLTHRRVLRTIGILVLLLLLGLRRHPFSFDF